MGVYDTECDAAISHNHAERLSVCTGFPFDCSESLMVSLMADPLFAIYECAIPELAVVSKVLTSTKAPNTNHEILIATTPTSNLLIMYLRISVPSMVPLILSCMILYKSSPTMRKFAKVLLIFRK